MKRLATSHFPAAFTASIIYLTGCFSFAGGSASAQSTAVSTAVAETVATALARALATVSG